MARPMSIVKINDPTNSDIVLYGLKQNERFLYLGEVLQDPLKAIVQEIDSGKVFITIDADLFDEVSVGDY
jgi:hypothetical protein